MTSTYDPLLDPSYVAASRVPQLLGGFITPIPIELCTTGFRLWIKLRPGSKEKLAFDDYLMAFVTVCLLPALASVERLSLADRALTSSSVSACVSSAWLMVSIYFVCIAPAHWTRARLSTDHSHDRPSERLRTTRLRRSD